MGHGLVHTEIRSSKVEKNLGIEMSKLREENMETKVFIGPPEALHAYGPSALMRYFIAAGGWSYSAFAVEVSERHKRQSVSLDSVANWANYDVEPTIYRAALLRLLDDVVDANFVGAWRRAFWEVWAEHRARPKKRNTPPGVGTAQSVRLASI